MSSHGSINAFHFDPSEVQWADDIGPEPPFGAGQRRGRMASFVEILQANPGRWGRYPYSYVSKATSVITDTRKRYPQIEWEARGDSMYGRFPG